MNCHAAQPSRPPPPGETVVDDNIVSVVEPCLGKCQFAQLAHRMSYPGGDDIIVRCRLPEHERHGACVVTREAPISTAIETTQRKRICESRRDTRYR